MNKEELQNILTKHQKWLRNEKDGKCANLYGANLLGADLYDAKLLGANLYDANLYGADLRDANLYGAKLRGAKLLGANLLGADLYDADLDKKEQIRKGIIVQKKLTGWKKCRNGVLVKLEIPKGAIVFCINGSKCRTNVAKIVKIEGGDGKSAVSTYNINFVYKLGKTIKIDDFNCMYNVECSTGIHFFRTKKEANEFNG